MGLFLLLQLAALSLATPLTGDGLPSSNGQKLEVTSRFAPLKKLDDAKSHPHLKAASYSTVIRPTNQLTQLVIEVKINDIPRYLLLDTGSADTWMTAPDFQCLNANLSHVPLRQCAFGDPYTGPKIPQIKNETYFQVYGTGETLYGEFGFADVTVAGLTVHQQKVALVNKAYGIGDNVRSGVFGVAPRKVTALYKNTDKEHSPPNGTATPYRTVFEGMYEGSCDKENIPPVFSLALQRGETGGYIAFGGLPPVEFEPNFVFTPFRGLNYYGQFHRHRYYPIRPDGFRLNGKKTATKYRAIVDSGTGINRLPPKIADEFNAAL